MARSVAVRLAALAAAGLVAACGAAWFGGSRRDPVPPLFTVSAEGPEIPDPTRPLVLSGGGVRLELPVGFRVRPGSLAEEPGSVRLRVAGDHGVLGSLAFYREGAGRLREGFLALASGPPDPDLSERLLAGSTILSSRTQDLPGGKLVQFEMAPAGAPTEAGLPVRELALVLVPAKGEGLATFFLRFPFRPTVARQLGRLLDRVAFPG